MHDLSSNVPTCEPSNELVVSVLRAREQDYSESRGIIAFLKGSANVETLSSPTRLVDMGSIATGRIKIVEPRHHNEQIMGKYVTLSHCW